MKEAIKRILGGWKYAAIVVGLAILAVLVMDFNSRMAEWRQLSVQHAEVSKELSQMQETQVALQTQIAYATSENAVKDWAYEQGHMVRNGDQIVIPVPAEGITPEPSPTPVVTQKVIANWQLWLSLFLDSH